MTFAWICMWYFAVPTGEEGGEEEQPGDLVQEDSQRDLRAI